MLSILQRYISKSYLSAWLLGILVLTFVLSIGLLVKATQLVVKGLPPSLVFEFIKVGIPESLAFTIPLASLVSALLLFGRLSADGEISAMRSCGINIWRIMTPLIVFGIALTTLSIYINGEVAPKGTARRHDLLNGTTKTVDLIKLLEPGRFIKDFNGVDVWFESKDGDTLKNLLILEKTKSGENRETRCEEAILKMGDSNLTIHMRNVRITPFSDNIPGTATADSFSYVIQNVIKKKKAKVKVGDLTNSEISEKISSINHFCEIDDPGKALSSEEITKGLAFAMKKLDKSQEELTIEDRKFGYAAMAKRSKSIHLTEYNRRIAFGMAPIAFILLGMPLGIRTSRRESNIGIAISLVVMLLYYAFMLLAKTTAHHPQIFPHLIVWLPTVISVTIAAILIRKNQ